jgi:ABC-2 type transport system ATP-binding protein
VRTPRAAELRAALERDGLRAAEGAAGELIVETADVARVGEIAFAAGVPVHELTPRATSLEEAFLALTSDVPAGERALGHPEAP